MDNQMMLLQILQGVVPGVSKRQQINSGRPEAGKRFVSGEELSTLNEGITVSVHHIDSDTTICLVIADRQLDMLADNFQLPSKDYPLIAKELFARAADTIRLHLTNGMCKDVTLSIRLKKEEEPKKRRKNLLMQTPLQDRYSHTSRRYGRINKQKGRLGAAAFLLDVLEAQDQEPKIEELLFRGL
jgi:hypothetical protein